MIGKVPCSLASGARMDGVIDRKDRGWQGRAEGQFGDTVEAFCMGWSDEGIKLTVKISGDMVDSSIEQAFKSHIPVEGKVTGVRKGGYSVQVSNVEGFCPLSQIDGRGVKRESEEYVGQVLTFLVTDYSEDGRNLVLSRRRLLDQKPRRSAVA